MTEKEVYLCDCELDPDNQLVRRTHEEGSLLMSVRVENNAYVTYFGNKRIEAPILKTLISEINMHRDNGNTFVVTGFLRFVEGELKLQNYNEVRWTTFGIRRMENTE